LQLRGLARALHDFHTKSPRKNIFHHDIKPADILVCGSDNTLKITDWGCACVKSLTAYAGPGTPTSGNKGNPYYLPPECRKGPSSRPHDVWSLGCVFLELLIWFHQGSDELHTFCNAIETSDNYKKDWATADMSALRPNVLAKMAYLDDGGYAVQINVIRGMLKIAPSARLKAQAVTNAI
jgi:serine/threonine protein kinase